MLKFKKLNEGVECHHLIKDCVIVRLIHVVVDRFYIFDFYYSRWYCGSGHPRFSLLPSCYSGLFED